MKVSRFVFNMFGVNTYIIYESESREAAIIDPGMLNEDERRAIDSFVATNDLKPTHLINTHSHLDHIFGNSYIKDKYGLGIEANKSDEFLALTLPEQAARFGLPMTLTSLSIDKELKDGDVIRIGNERIEILSVPGHSPGSIALYCPESGFVITGDAIFPDSIGRTDLPQGDFPTLIDSIKRKLLTLPDSTVILSGHGGETTVGNEKRSNPYVK